jgi:dinuclear metal center YbgI/SA1388 family protein
MRITEFIRGFQEELPLSLAVADDPVGMQVMPEDLPLHRVAAAYEINERAVDRAVELQAQLVVAFHPLMYPAADSITPSDRVGRTIIRLIEHRIALYIVHTAFDAHPDGTSMLLGRELGLTDLLPIERIADHPDAGMGAVGTFPEALALAEVAARIREVCATPVVRTSCADASTLHRPISRLGILGGSGMSYYPQAIRAGADAFVTGDVRYHGFHAANDRIPVLDPGHAESERFVLPGLAALLRTSVRRLDSSIDIVELTESTNPIEYLM